MRLAAPNRAHLFALLALLFALPRVVYSESPWEKRSFEGAIKQIEVIHYDNFSIFAAASSAGPYSFDDQTQAWFPERNGLTFDYSFPPEAPTVSALTAHSTDSSKVWMLEMTSELRLFDFQTHQWEYISSIPPSGDNYFSFLVQSEVDDSLMLFVGSLTNFPLHHHPDDRAQISRDMGRTWQPLDSTIVGPIQEVLTPNWRIFVGDHYSEDGGETWHDGLNYPIGGDTVLFTAHLELDPRDGSIWSLAVPEDDFKWFTDLYHSSDGGDTWSLVRRFPRRVSWLYPHHFTMTTSGIMWYCNYGSLLEGSASLYFSFDEGQTWTPYELAKATTLFNALGYISDLEPTNDDSLFIACSGGVWKVAGDGSAGRWVTDGLTSCNPSEVEFVPGHENLLYVNNGAYLHVSEDSGATWHVSEKLQHFEFSITAGETPILYLHFQLPDSNGANQQAVLYRDATDLSAPFHRQDFELPYVQMFGPGTWQFHADPFMKGRLYVYGYEADTAYVWTSSDTGRTWKRRDLYNPYHRFFVNVDREVPGFVATPESHFILISHDHGGSWEKLNPPVAEVIQVLPFPEDDSSYVILSDYGVYLTRDFGATFRTIHEGMDYDEWRTGISVHRLPGVVPRRILFFGDDRDGMLTREVFNEQDEWHRESWSMDDDPPDVFIAIAREYWYRSAVDGVLRRHSEYSSSVAEPGAVQPASALLTSVYPNPFNSRTVFTLKVPHTALLDIRIFNVLGEQIQLVQLGPLSPGEHRFSWTAEPHLASGVYLAVIEAGSTMNTRRIVLVR